MCTKRPADRKSECGREYPTSCVTAKQKVRRGNSRHADIVVSYLAVVSGQSENTNLAI
jgi:hypothetical protein